MAFHGDLSNRKLQMGGEGGKKEAIYEGSSGNTRSSQLHCHNPETIECYTEDFSHTELWVGSWGGQKLMIVHLHKKKKKCFFRIILIALSLVKQFVQTLTVQSEEWVTSAFQYCLWEVEGLSSPHHKSLSTLGCLDRQWQSSQKVLYCEWSLSESEHYPLQKEQKSD